MLDKRSVEASASVIPRDWRLERYGNRGMMPVLSAQHCRLVNDWKGCDMEYLSFELKGLVRRLDMSSKDLSEGLLAK